MFHSMHQKQSPFDIACVTHYSYHQFTLTSFINPILDPSQTLWDLKGSLRFETSLGVGRAIIFRIFDCFGCCQ